MSPPEADGVTGSGGATAVASYKYPHPRRDDTVVDDYHGTKVPDPYRYLEDPDGEETKNFVAEQNKITMPYIASCAERETIKKGLTELWDYEKFGCPFKKGNKYFISKNSGLQNQAVMYIQDSLEAEPRVFFDPNQLSEDGTVSLNRTSFSHDGLTMAYALSQSGSDWVSIRFRNVLTGEDYPEVLEKAKFTSLAWTHDNKGVFYNCYPHFDKADGKDATSLDNQKVYYHLLGSSQEGDVLCLEFPENPKYIIGVQVSDCGRYLIATPSKDCKYNLVSFCDLQVEAKDGIKGKLTMTPIVSEPFDADYDYITNIGTKAIFQTNKNAKNSKLVRIDLEKPDPANWEDLLAEDQSDVLEWAGAVAGDKLVTCYMHDVKNTMQLRDLNTGEIIHSFKLDIGSITGFSGDIRHQEFMYKFSSQITPGTIFHVDLTSSQPQQKLLIQTKVHNFNPDDYKVEQVFFPSKDGTKVPMFVTSRKDFVPGSGSDGQGVPCLLYGYGGFSISLTPTFSITNLFFVQHFGISVIVNMRGGGEYGERWTDGGRLANLQNCLTDFQSAADYLVKERYTSTPQLTIYGGSHGGMLVGACTNQRPELYGAAVSAVGVMDMLRFHKFTVGYAWVSNYGCSDKEDECQNLLNISPLNNIKVPATGQYPAVLCVTADHDDRVVPSHSLKYMATLQHTLGGLESQKNPLMIRVDTKAGHGAGKPTSKVIEEYTDIFSFLIKSLGIQYRQ